MRVAIHLDDQNQEWVITPLSGKFEGRAVVRAEGVSLTEVKIDWCSVTANVRALWGATLLEDLDAHTLNGLGLGNARGMGWKDLTNPKHAVISEGWFVDEASGDRITETPAMNLRGLHIEYR